MAKTAILIDDDQDDLDFLEEAIHEVDKSLVCVPFTDGEEAIRLISAKDSVAPDYIFIDINMPKITGDKCLKELRKNHAFDNVFITLVSTYMPKSVSQNLKNCGANFTFIKPNKFGGYNEILKKILEQ